MNKNVYIAYLNYKNYKKDSRYPLLIMIICSVLVLMFMAVSTGFNKICDGYKEDYALNEIELYNDNVIENDTLGKISELNHVKSIKKAYQLVLGEYEITVENKKLYCSGIISGIDVGYDSFSYTEVLSKNKGLYEEPIIRGREFIDGDTGKAIIDENYIYILGYDLSDILGKTISVSVGEKSVTDVEIVGVFSCLYGSFDRSYENEADFILNDIYSSSNNPSPLIFSSDITKDLSTDEMVFDYVELNPIVSVDKTSNVKSLCDIFANNYSLNTISLVDAIEKRTSILNSIKGYIILIASIVLLISFIGMTNSLIVKINKQKSFTLLMRKQGYTRGDIIKIYVIENLIIVLKAIIISFTISFILSILMDMIIQNAYVAITRYKRFVFLIDFRFSFNYYLILTLIVSIVTALVSCSIIRRKKKYEFKT